MAGLLSACQKGRVIPEVVYVSLDTNTTWVSFPGNTGSGYDVQTESEHLLDFSNQLTAFLAENNVIINPDRATYRIRVKELIGEEFCHFDCESATNQLMNE